MSMKMYYLGRYQRMLEVSDFNMDNGRVTNQILGFSRPISPDNVWLLVGLATCTIQVTEGSS